MPKINHILETALYVNDMARALALYRDVLGLKVMENGERLSTIDAGRNSVLLLCTRGKSVADLPTPGGIIPGHDGAGPVHMAFAIGAGEYQVWRDHLSENGVTIRSEVCWERGGRSLYFNDPDGHVLELATPGLWPNY
jgi:catechol 2,3-dioxygenase-like lactoylglutathione lyase family enzyme